MSKANKPQLSIITTAHNEGILAHKTMLAIFRAAKRLEDENISYEIIVHIDNGNKETLDYFNRYSDDSSVAVYKNNFGDLSDSRNFSAQKASADIISFLDADDLCSENWLIDGYNKIKGNSNLVARCNYIVAFGDDSRETIVTNNSHINNELIYLIDSNMYGSMITCWKDVFIEYPQRQNKPPYGSEDWQWTLDTMGGGVENVVIPNSVLYYRQDFISKPSLLSSQGSYRAVLSPTKLLSYEHIKRINIQNNVSIREDNKSFKSKLKRRVYDLLTYANTFDTYRKIKHSVKGDTKAANIDLPPEIIEEWKGINKIEKLTFPSKYILDSASNWFPNPEVGEKYIKLNHQFSKKPDTLFFVPWLIRGGADKVFINTANQIQKNQPDWKMAMIQTMDKDSVWRNKLDEKIDFINLENSLKSLGRETQMRLLATFVVQNNTKRLIIGNSRFAYDFIRRYKKMIIAHNIRVYAFAFTEMIDLDGRVGDYIHEQLPLIQDCVYRIVTDNTSIVNQLYDEHAISKDKVFVHHQYLDNQVKEPEVRKTKKIKIMWASRITGQKTPEILRDIGRRIGSRYQIDMYGVFETPYSKEFFEDSNINYIRTFDGIEDLPTEEYDIFLYTSNADGMPNMLLEIASKGLPIITPNIGGVTDFIKDHETGLIVEDYTDVNKFVECVKEMEDYKLREKLAQNAQKLLKKEFTEEKWKNGVKEIFNK